MAWGATVGVASWLDKLKRNDASLTSVTVFRGRLFGGVVIENKLSTADVAYPAPPPPPPPPPRPTLYLLLLLLCATV